MPELEKPELTADEVLFLKNFIKILKAELPTLQASLVDSSQQLNVILEEMKSLRESLPRYQRD